MELFADLNTAFGKEFYWAASVRFENIVVPGIPCPFALLPYVGQRIAPVSVQRVEINVQTGRVRHPV